MYSSEVSIMKLVTFPFLLMILSSTESLTVLLLVIGVVAFSPIAPPREGLCINLLNSWVFPDIFFIKAIANSGDRRIRVSVINFSRFSGIRAPPTPVAVVKAF